MEVTGPPARRVGRAALRRIAHDGGAYQTERSGPVAIGLQAVPSRTFTEEHQSRGDPKPDTMHPLPELDAA